MHSSTHPTEQELLSIKKLLTSFSMALHNYALYPEEHSICQKNLATVQSHLDTCLITSDNLHLDVEEDKLLCEGEVVLRGLSQDDSLPFVLYRNGIQWIEFYKGITADELNTFIKLLIRYRILNEEADGNLVTALWESELLHFKYKADDILWKSEVLINLSDLKPTEIQHSDASEDTIDNTSSVHTNIAISTAGSNFLNLAPAEENKLQTMILEEMTRDSSTDVVDVLTTVFRDQQDPEHLKSIATYLIEKFHHDLTEGKFQSCATLLEHINALHHDYLIEKHWSLPILEYIRTRISSLEILKALESVWPLLSAKDTTSLDSLRHMLLLLPSEVILTLGTMLTHSRLPRIDKLIMEVINIHAGRDFNRLEQLLYTVDEPVISKIVQVLRNMKDNDPSQIFFKLTRHSSYEIQISAINALIARNPEHLRNLFPMIEDTKPAIRRKILDHLGRQKSKLSEELLLDYLEKRRFQFKDRQHVLSCYCTLGQCASYQSIPFLQNMLLNHNWKTFVEVPSLIHRQGAAMALLAMKNEEGVQACLHKASQSFSPLVRLTYWWALKADQK